MNKLNFWLMTITGVVLTVVVAWSYIHLQPFG